MTSNHAPVKPKAKRLKQESRHWSSGYVRLSVIGIEGHPEDNYIVLEKSFTGNFPQKEQRFILRERDWGALSGSSTDPWPRKGSRRLPSGHHLWSARRS
jgi:hypothetical protein